MKRLHRHDYDMEFPHAVNSARALHPIYVCRYCGDTQLSAAEALRLQGRWSMRSGDSEACMYYSSVRGGWMVVDSTGRYVTGPYPRVIAWLAWILED